MPIGFFTLLTPEYTPVEVIAHARRWGFDGIEWRIAPQGSRSAGALSYWANNRCSIPPEQIGMILPGLVEKARAEGLASPSICPYMTCLEAEKVEPLMAAMAEAGVGVLRVNTPKFDRAGNYREQFAAARRGYEAIEKLARKHGVRACVEQHHFNLTPSASACYRLVEGLDPKHVGVLVDTGNVLLEGYEQFEIVFDLLGEYIAEVHVKNGWRVPAKSVNGFQKWDAVWGPLDTGMVDLSLLAGALRRSRFSGWLMLEDFSPRPTEQRMTEGVATLRKLAATEDKATR